jgi:hypothetical protein
MRSIRSLQEIGCGVQSDGKPFGAFWQRFLGDSLRQRYDSNRIRNRVLLQLGFRDENAPANLLQSSDTSHGLFLRSLRGLSQQDRIRRRDVSERHTNGEHATQLGVKLIFRF